MAKDILEKERKIRIFNIHGQTFKKYNSMLLINKGEVVVDNHNLDVVVCILVQDILDEVDCIRVMNNQEGGDILLGDN
uniref:Uncharacterized protein n=1 Tax=Panagrolaimus sp. PS1159 TaxID=55785 RepID=A0AC35FYY8_9BILA